MPPIVLCAANISQGRDQAVISRIAGAVKAVPDAAVLDVDSGEDTNRTVITFAGPPNAVADAAFGVIAAAIELIDMAAHTGSHARMGAADVCPFIPVADVTIERCVDLAKDVGRRVAAELVVPVYLYGYAATRPERVKLSDIRRGEYEGLAARLADPAFRPDFGPARFIPKSGATAIGVRPFLLAYNVNLNTPDVAVANEIAARIRQSGRIQRDDRGEAVTDKAGHPVRIAGELPHCQAGGWAVEAYGCAQVTMNLPNFSVTGLHTAYEAVRRAAVDLGTDVTGSELVGLTPRQALLDAGRFYLEQQGQRTGIPEADLVATAVRCLGLTDKTPFDPDEKIIERRVADLLGE